MNARQLGLFGDDEPIRRPGVGPAEPDASAATIAATLPDGVRLGTSSWSFPGWAGLVYDREAPSARLAREGLAAYARHPLLRSVGIDRTFYAPVTAATLAAYAAAVEPSFRFLVKAASQCTSPYERGRDGRPAGRNATFLDPAFAAAQVVEPFVEGLGERGGPLVFQFPPLGRPWVDEPQRFADLLGGFLGALPVGPLYAVELRDERLLTGDYAQALAAAGARHCVAVHPRMPDVASQLAATSATGPGPLVVRWMLHRGLGYDEAKQRYAPFRELVDPDPVTRGALARAAAEQVVAGGPVYVIANNKAEGSAPLSVFALAAEIAGRLDESSAADE